jgi:hypothetical protein
LDHKRMAAERFDAAEGELRAISRWMFENPETA